MQSTITFFTVLLCIVCSAAYAQSYNVIGRVTNNSGNAIGGVTVLLLKSADSSVVQYGISEEDGSFVITEAKAGKYLVNTQAIGYEKSYREIDIIGHATLDITLQEDSKKLQEVTITGKKPYIEKGLGKTIVNLDQTNTSAGSNVLELLRKMPGIIVDMNGNISLKGMGAMVLIDDKQTYLTGDQLAAYLKGLSAEQVAKLELIDQPSAKYDAEGSGGIINIKMKKLKKGGFNGSINLSGQYATFINTDNSANINYRKNKVNLYANAGYVRYTGYLDMQSSKQVTDGQTGNIINTSELDAYMQETPINYNLQTGIDYTVKDKLTIGGNVKGIYNPLTEVGITKMTIIDIPSNKTIYNESHTGYDVNRYHLNGNVYATYNLSEKSNLSLDADYIRRDVEQDHHLNSYNYNAQMQPLNDNLLLKLSSPTRTRVYVARADYSTELNSKWQLETGIKTNIANIRATSDYQINTGNGWQNDTTRSNDLVYRENINAAYVSGSRAFGEHWQTQLGLRAEQTIIVGEQLADGQTFGFNKTSLFPTAIVYYKVNDNHAISLNFNKRVQRPSYRELNPFITFISQYAYTSGNPKLQPQYRYALDADYSYKNILSTSVGYRVITNDRNPELFFDAVRNATWLTTANNATRYVFHASEGFNKQLFSWWYMQAQADMYLVSYTRNDGALFFAKSLAGEIGVSSQFTLGKGWSLDTTISYTTGGLQSMIESNGQTLWIGFNAAKKIWKDAATIKLSVGDPLNIYAYTPESNWNNIHSTSVMKNASQQVSVGFAYNFGKHDDNSGKREKSAEESGRM